jgi:hypothetical protein
VFFALQDQSPSSEKKEALKKEERAPAKAQSIEFNPLLLFVRRWA